MFKLIVSDTLVVPVEGTTQADGKESRFKFDLLCRRSTADELREDLRPADGDEVSLKAFMRDRITGWRDVLDEDGKPLDFDDESVAALLNFPGMAAIATTAYIDSCGAKGKEKNLRK